jgi:hypothetical protein
MAENPNTMYLLGKKCGKDGNHEFRKLQQYMSILGLSAPTQSYLNICKMLIEYCKTNKINTEEEMKKHIEMKSKFNTSRTQSVLQSKQQSVQPQLPPQPQPQVPVQFQQLSDLDILFLSDPTELYQHTETFRNLNNYSRRVQQIGDISGNGFIRKLSYTSEGNNYSIILKSNLDSNSDNLVYEYLVGLCINEFSKFFPCFAKSYMVGLYNNPSSRQLFENISNIQTIPNNLNSYIRSLDTQDLNQIVKRGCNYNEYICIFTQYVPIEMVLINFLDSIQNTHHNKLYELAIILHITYSLLSSLADYFTHYDLHTSNIALVKIPNNQFVNIRLHLPDGVTIVSYKSIYIPVIIDYGHIFANCKNINQLLNSSDEIIKTSCEHDNSNPSVAERQCVNRCGDATGYNWNPIYNRATRTFNPQTPVYYFIDPTKKNITHDVKLLNLIRNNLSNRNFDVLINSNYIGRTLMGDFFRTKLIDLETPYGSSQNPNPDNRACYNVHSAFFLINEIIANPEFNANNDLLFVGKTLYKTIDIWHGANVNRAFTVS